MARFSGSIGFITDETEENPGYYGPKIVEKNYKGSLMENSVRRSDSSEGTNDTLTLSTKVSIVADAYLLERLYGIKYVTFRTPKMGGRWCVTDIKPVDRRIILTIGGVYNGPTAGTTNET